MVSLSDNMSGFKTIELKMLLKRSDAGSIIGLDGTKISRVRKESQAVIHLSKDIGSQRILSISGNKERIEHAMSLILEALDEKNESLRRKPIKLVLPDRLCKELVCKDAQQLQIISKQTGVKIKVEPMCLPGSSERVVVLDEGRGDMMEGIKALINLCGDISLPLNNKPYIPPSEIHDLENLEILTHDFSWSGDIASIIELARKLGLKMSSEGKNMLTAKGPAGSLDILKSIIVEKQEDCKRMPMKQPVPTCGNKFPCMNTTASLLAAQCQVKKYENM